MITLRRIIVAVASLNLVLVVSCKRNDPPIIGGNAKTAKTEPERAKAKEYRHDEPAEVAGFKIELLRGSVTKIEHMPFGKLQLTKEDYFRVDLRITNNSDAVLEYRGWYGDFPQLFDEQGRKYPHKNVMTKLTEAEKKLDKGRYLEDAVAFELPKADAKEFRLEIPCNMIGKPDDTIAFKIPREFFKRK